MWVHRGKKKSKRAGDLCIDIIKGIVEYCRLAGDEMIAYELLEDAYFAFALGAGITSLLLINNMECDNTELKDAIMGLLLTKISSLSTQIKEGQPDTEERRRLVAQRDLLQDLRNELFQEKREENPKVEDERTTQKPTEEGVKVEEIVQESPEVMRIGLEHIEEEERAREELQNLYSWLWGAEEETRGEIEEAGWQPEGEEEA